MTAESTDGETDGSLSSVVATAVTSLTLIVAFGLLAVGWEPFWVVFIIGFAGVLPLATTLAKRYERRESAESGTETEPLDALRERYARGEIDEAEFERRVEALLETESEVDAEQFYGDASGPRSPESTHIERERERERN